MAKRKTTKTQSKKAKARAPSQFPHVSHPKKRAFLAAYARLGTVGRSADAAGISRRTHCNWMDEEGTDGDAYREAFRDAKAESGDILEAEARRRAVEGVTKPVFGSLGQGQGSGQIGAVQEYSDTLLIFLMKGAMPEKYRERSSTEISGPGGKPLETTTTIATVTHDDWYGNADRLPAPSAEPSGENPALPGSP